MKHIFILLTLVTFLYSHLQAKNVDVNSSQKYLGESYNVLLAVDKACIYIKPQIQQFSSHSAITGNFAHCDHYDDSQQYLNESLLLGSGITLFSDTPYRSGLFLSFGINLEKSWIRDNVNDKGDDMLTFRLESGLGYQYHFMRGYILALQLQYIHYLPINNNRASKEFESEIYQSKFMPMIMLGWRF